MTPKLTLFVPVALLFGGVLLISGIREQYVVQPVKPMKAIPALFLGESSTDVVVGEEERRVAGMSDYVMRVFGPDSAPDFTVYVGYYDRQVQGKTIHSPKNCLPGAGWEILTSERVPLPGGGAQGGTVNRVLLANKGVRTLVYYWYQGRGRVESSEYRVKWDLLRDAALYGRTEEALVRIVIPVKRSVGDKPPSNNDAAITVADAVAKKVATELAPEVRKVLPALNRS